MPLRAGVAGTSVGHTKLRLQKKARLRDDSLGEYRLHAALSCMLADG